MTALRYLPPSSTASRRAIITAGFVVGLELVLEKFFAKPVKRVGVPANGPADADRLNQFVTSKQLQTRL